MALRIVSLRSATLSTGSLVCLLPLVACGSGADSGYADAPSAPAAAAAGATGNYPDPGATDPTAALVFAAQDGWVAEQPDGTMRVAQFRLPRVEGDEEDASLVVYHFPSSGTVEMNFRRWAGQLSQEDGSNTWDSAVQSERKVRGMAVHQLDCSGRYVAETFPGSGVRVDKPGYRLLGAVVESSEGPYYVKAIGPAATLGHWKSSYENFLSSL